MQQVVVLLSRETFTCKQDLWNVASEVIPAPTNTGFALNDRTGEMNQKLPLLCQAISEGSLQKVKQLLEHKTNLEQAECELLTPLQYAVVLGNLEITKALLVAGASVSHQAQWLVERASPEDKTEILMELVKAGINVDTRIFDDGQTILMEMAGRGNFSVVKALVDVGADVNAICHNGTYALSRAASGGYQEVFNYLLPLTCQELRTEAESALSKGVISRQRLNDHFTEDLIQAAATGDIDTVINIIKRGVNINAFGSDEVTALYIAAYWGHLPVVCILVEAGANIELGRETDNETPLIAASGNALLFSKQETKTSIRQLKVLQMLIQAGANVNARTNEGWNALEAAANSGSIEAVNLLVRAGADINAKDHRGGTALSRAKQRGAIEIVQTLQRFGAID